MFTSAPQSRRPVAGRPLTSRVRFASGRLATRASVAEQINRWGVSFLYDSPTSPVAGESSLLTPL